MSPRSGKAMKTKFSYEVTNWRDVDGPLCAHFGYKLKNSKKEPVWVDMVCGEKLKSSMTLPGILV